MNSDLNPVQDNISLPLEENPEPPKKEESSLKRD